MNRSKRARASEEQGQEQEASTKELHGNAAQQGQQKEDEEDSSGTESDEELAFYPGAGLESSDDDDDDDDEDDDDDDSFGDSPNPSSLPDPNYDCEFDDDKEVDRSEAESKCAKHLLKSDFAQFCNESGVDIQSHYETCVLEVCLVDDTGAVSSALDSLIEECLDSTLPSEPSASPSSNPTPSPSSTFDLLREDDPEPLPSPSPSMTGTPSTSGTPSVTSSVSPTSSPTGTATPSVTATPTSSNTGTATPSPSSSETATHTHSPSVTSTSTSSNTGTATPSTSSSATATHTRSPSVTSTSTSSITGTTTPSTSSSVTATHTRTPSSSETATPSTTSSHTKTASPSVTATPTRSHTGTATSSVSSTATSSTTRTVTPSVTSTSTSSNTGTATSSASSSETATQTRSPSSSKTATPSTTPSRTGTATPSVTATATSSNTPSRTRSETPTTSVTSSATGSVSATGTATESSTRTPSATVTRTASETPSSSSTQTQTSTSSPTSSSTRSPSNTVTPTRSSSATGSKTSTPSPTKTGTGSRTPSETASSTSSVSGTVTATITPSETGSSTSTGSPTETRTGTSTPSVTPSSTISGTASRTSSKTPTSSLTSSATAAVTSTRTPTASSTSSPSMTGTGTAKRIPTGTPTVTSTASSSVTATVSSTGTSTQTATGTSSSTVSPTSSSSTSETASSTMSPTNTGSNTASPSTTATLTSSVTSSVTASMTPTPTETMTPTGTASSTPTHSASGSVTATPTPTASQSGTPTSSITPSKTTSATASATRSESPSSSLTSSASVTVTSTGTATLSSTASPSASGTGTLTRTPSGSVTASVSSTGTPSTTRTTTPSTSNTITGTPTYTVSPTASSSVTGTETPSISPSNTVSRTPSSSETSTASGSVSGTVSGTRTPTATGSPSSSGSPPSGFTSTATPYTSFSATASSSPSTTSSATASQSGTFSGTGTLTPVSASSTGSSGATASKSPSATVSHSSTPRGIATSTPSLSASSTDSPSKTASKASIATISQSGTPSGTGPSTASKSSSATASESGAPSGTATSTPSTSASSTGSPIAPASQSSSATASHTTTASKTGTSISSETASPSASSSAAGTEPSTVSPSETSSNTASLFTTSSQTATRTPTASMSSTGSTTGSSTVSSTPSITSSNSRTPSVTPSADPSEGCLNLTPQEKLKFCPSLCSGNGICTCSGCVCSGGWTGRACGVEVSEEDPSVSEFHPEAGLMVPGQVIDVTGDYLISSMLANKGGGPYLFNETVLQAYECVARDREGEAVSRFPFQVATDTEGSCRIPDTLDEVIYGTDQVNMKYSDLVDAALQCPIVPRRQIVSLEVHLKEPRAILGEMQYMLGRCRPNKWFRGGVTCSDGGKCSKGGYCICPSGWCGSKCSIRSNWNGCGGNDHPDLPLYHAYVFGNWQTPDGSDVEGLTAMEGNAVMGRYSVGALWDAPSDPFLYGNDVVYTDRDDLAVKGKLDFSQGAVLGGGNIVYGSNQSFVPPTASVDEPGRKLQANSRFPFPVDFHGARYALRALSQRLASLPRTGTAHIRFSTLYLKGIRPDVNVFHVNAHDLFRARTVDLDLSTIGEKNKFEPFGASPLKEAGFRPFIAPPGQWDPESVPTTIINVIWNDTHTEYGAGPGDLHEYRRNNASLPAFAHNVSFMSKGFTGDFYKDNYSAAIIWNLPVARDVYIKQIDVVGTLLAPNAHVDFPTGQMRGNLWAKSFRGQGQINLPLYRGTCHPEAVGSMLDLNGGEIDLQWLDAGAQFEVPFFSGDMGEWNVSQSYPIQGRRGQPIKRIDDLVGRFGAPPIPECRRYGFMAEDYTCHCWDRTYRRGVECRTRCIDYCNGRGMCNGTNPDMCDCFDPLRWTGDRCETSRCGPNAWVSQSDPFDEKGNVKCRCLHGWKGPHCLEPIGCVHGTIRGDQCVCAPGYSGEQCSDSKPQLISCFHGDAVTKVTGEGESAMEIYECKCSPGWTGRTCNQRDDESGNSPALNATCTFGRYNESLGGCICDTMWIGENCDVRICEHGNVVPVHNTGSVYGSVIQLELAAASGDQQANRMLPFVGSSAKPFDETNDGIRLSDRVPQYQCVCKEGWFGAACDRGCREVCNFRGSACGSNSRTNANVVSCTCEAPWSGSRCEDLIIEKPFTETNDNDSILTEVVDLSYVRGGSSSFVSDRLRGRRQLEAEHVQISARISMTASAWRDSEVIVQTGTNEEILEICEMAMSSDFAVAAGESGIGFGPAERLVVSCLPVRLKFETIRDIEVHLAISLDTSLKESITEDEQQMMFVSLLNTDVFDDESAAFVYSSMTDFDRSTGELNVSVPLHSPDETLHLMVLQPNIGERRRILSQGAGNSGGTIGINQSRAGLVGVIVGTLVGTIVLVLAAVAIWASFGKSAKPRFPRQRIAVSPSNNDEKQIPRGPVVEQPGGNSSDAVESLFADSA
eukprot:gb/GECG01012755.1/.p1 GENE.gb/GECG01012755.1/~~gb/GECG01012755.1/.p1  ORF type:complete len:2443 (+),score=281.71 gb/GECG01012755.1/:1-7329(+)